MRNFPTEILLLVFDNLRLSDLSRTARCCRLYHTLATPKLYETLRIRMKSRMTDQQVQKLLGTLMQPSYIHQFIRRVDVVVDDDCLWTRDHSWLLSIMLKHILNHLDASKRVQSYRWTASYPFTGLVFPNLRQLDCGAVGPQSIEWVRWHLNHCASLAEVHLSFTLACNLTQLKATALLNRANFSRVERLNLAFIDVALFDPKKAPMLRSLDLRYCPGAESFCQRLAAATPTELTDVRIAAHAESGTPDNFTKWLGSARNVEHVALCIGGLTETIPFEQVKGHRSTLRTLVLDPRRNVLDPSSVLKYRPADLREIVEQCASLRTLGLPLDLRDYQCRLRYTRSHQIKRIIPSCALETLHLRGRDHSPQRSRVDAKHLARRFLLKQYSVRVLIGHGRGMNAFTTTDGRTIVSTRLSRREQFQLCAE